MKIDPTRAHRLIAVGNQEMQLILDDIKHVCTPKTGKALPLNDHKRRKQRELYYIVIDHFLTGYLRHQTKKSNSDYDSKKLEFISASHKHMEGMVGDAWDRIRDNLIEVGILVPNDRKNIPEDSIKKTAKSYSAGNINTEPYSRAFRLDSKWLKESKYSVTELKYVAEKHYPLKASEIKTEPTQSTKITIDVDAAISTLNDMAADPKDKTTMPTALMFTRRLLRFNTDDRAPTICSTGREFNKVNGLPAKVRKHILINQNQTIELDIKSCLPSILYKYTTEQNERLKMQTLIKHACLYRVTACKTNMLDYRFINNDYTDPNDEDIFTAGITQAKLAFCCYLGGSIKPHAKKIAAFIESHLPVLNKRLTDLSKGKERGEISRLLQNSESAIVVEGMGNKPYTTVSIHDGVMVERQHAKQAHQHLMKLFKDEVGIDPIVTGLEDVTAQPQPNPVRPSRVNTVIQPKDDDPHGMGDLEEFLASQSDSDYEAVGDGYGDGWS